MSKHKLSDVIQVPVDIAEEIINKFFAVVPKVKEFLDMIGSYAVSARKSISPPPYRRIRWMEWKEEWERSAVERAGKNNPMQAGNADMLKCALGRLYYFIVTNNLQVSIKPVITVHDEIRTECIKSLSDWWAIELEKIMVESGQIIIKTIPVVVDVKQSDHWGK